MTVIADDLLHSCMCTQEQLESPRFQDWAERLGEPRLRLHRKLWEYCFVTEALAERGMLEPGRRGLGLAVGTEPLASLYCALGAEVVATDLGIDGAGGSGRVHRGQHADSLYALNRRGLCPEPRFREACSFRSVDRNDIPDDLTGFDFVWSSCALEHLGSIELGIRFVVNAMSCLRPGGVAVHTTQYNCSSNDATITEGGTVLFRRRDFEEIGQRLTDLGHSVSLDFTAGSAPADHFVDLPPYKQDVHLKLMLDEYVISSYGLVVTAAE